MFIYVYFYIYFSPCILEAFNLFYRNLLLVYQILKSWEQIILQIVLMESRPNRTKKQEISKWTWKNIKTCIIGQSSTHVREKIAGFDMDSTLVVPKSGAKFPKNATDWIYWHESVPKKIKQLYQQGYKIVIFTNQKGISTGQTKAQDIKKKIQDLAIDMDVQMQAVIATKDDQFRKPNTKMWELFVQHNDGKANLKQSLFCGDAAGRKTATHKDFTDSDLKFALNVGVKFMTPQNLFLDQKEQVQVGGFNPKQVSQTGNLFANSADKDVKFVQKQMVIFSGAPGAGKSTFWHNYMPQYERVNRDTLKTKQKCYKVAEQFIKQGKSVIIDNTNPKKEDRKYFLDLAKKHNYKARCFFFLTQKDVCAHNDSQRGGTNLARKHFSGKAGKIARATYFKYSEKPSLDQGFYEVKEVNFIAKFYDEADRQAYQKLSSSK